MKYALVLAGLTALLALAFCRLAPAASVTYHMDLSVPGKFRIFASASLDDNFGLAAYALPLTPETTSMITSYEHLSPVASVAVGDDVQIGPAGFQLVRSEFTLPSGGLLLGAAQDTIFETPHLIRGLGQSASSFAGLGITPTSPTVIQPQWDAALLVARGTYTGDAADFRIDTIGLDLGANVLAGPTGFATMRADIYVTGTNGFSYDSTYVPPPPPPPPPIPVAPPEVVPPVVSPPIAAPADPPIGAQPHEPGIDPLVELPGIIDDPILRPGFTLPIDGDFAIIDISESYFGEPIDSTIDPGFTWHRPTVVTTAFPWQHAIDRPDTAFDWSSLNSRIVDLRRTLEGFRADGSAFDSIIPARTTAAAVPEPASILLISFVVIGAYGFPRRRCR